MNPRESRRSRMPTSRMPNTTSPMQGGEEEEGEKSHAVFGHVDRCYLIVVRVRDEYKREDQYCYVKEDEEDRIFGFFLYLIAYGSD